MNLIRVWVQAEETELVRECPFIFRENIFIFYKSCLKSTVAQSSRQFQFDHGNINLPTAQFQLPHGNFNLLTAISICSRQYQSAHGNFNLLTAISICSRQFQFAHGNIETAFYIFGAGNGAGGTKAKQ